MVKKVSISLSPESLAQLDFLREKLRLNPKIKLSSLIQQVIFDEYSRLQSSHHGFPDSSDDCSHCRDEPICNYSRYVDDTSCIDDTRYVDDIYMIGF